MGARSLLSNKGYVLFNKSIARSYGITTAIVLGELCGLAETFDGKEFFFQMERIEYNTSLSAFQVREAMKKLCETGILTITKKGIPCKNWYYLDEESIERVVDECAERDRIEKENAEKSDENELDVKPVNEQLSKNLTAVCKNSEPHLSNNINNKYINNKYISSSDNNSSLRSELSSSSSPRNSTKKAVKAESDKSSSLSEEIPFPTEPLVSKETKRKSNKRQLYISLISQLNQNKEYLISQNKNIDKVEYPYKALCSMLKKLLDMYSEEQVIQGIKNSVKNDWLVNEAHYSLTAVLSPKMFAKYISSQSVNNKSQTTKIEYLSQKYEEEF